VKVIKLTNKQRNMEVTDLLKSVGLVDGSQAYPSQLYVSKNDAKRLYKKIEAMGRKQGYTKKGLKNAVGMHWLNYGPNTSLELAIKDGYAIIEDIPFEDGDL